MTVFLIILYILIAIIFAGANAYGYAMEREINDDEARVWARRFLASPFWPVLVARWLHGLWQFANHNEGEKP